MTQASRIATLAQRIGTEFKTLRSEIGTARVARVTKQQYAQLSNRDGKQMYYITDWGLNGPVIDDFNRADSMNSLGGTSVGNYPWLYYGDPWGISSQQAYKTAGSGNAGIAYQELGTVDHYSEATVVSYGNSSAVVGRVVDANNYISVGNDSGGNKGVYKTVGGNTSAITLASGSVSAITDGDLIRLSFRGSIGTVSRNGTAIATFNDTSLGTKAGMRAAYATYYFDNFKADSTVPVGT